MENVLSELTVAVVSFHPLIDVCIVCCTSCHSGSMSLVFYNSLMPRRSRPPGERKSGVINKLSCHRPHDC